MGVIDQFLEQFKQSNAVAINSRVKKAELRLTWIAIIVIIVVFIWVSNK